MQRKNTLKLTRNCKAKAYLVFLVIKITLKRFLEGFLVRLTKSLTKNPSRNRFNVILMGKKTRLKKNISE